MFRSETVLRNSATAETTEDKNHTRKFKCLQAGREKVEKYYRDLLYELKFKLRTKSTKFLEQEKKYQPEYLDNKSNQHGTKYCSTQREDIDA